MLGEPSMVFHKFKMHSISDEPYVELYPKLASFFETEKGSWVLKHSLSKIEHETVYDMHNICYYVLVKGQLSKEDKVWFYLKWDPLCNA